MSELLFVQMYGYEKPVHARGIIQADNRDFIMAGRVYDNHDKALVTRVMANGNIAWEKTFEAGYSAFFESIARLADGSLVAVGTYFHSEMSGDEQVWIVKIDEMGNKIAEKILGDEEIKNDGYDVTATSDGGFLVTGLVFREGADMPLTWVIKFDKDFNQVWDKYFDGGVAYSAIQTKDGGYALAGAHMPPDSLLSGIYVLRLDAAGNTLWERIFTEYEIYVFIDGDILEDSDGNLLIAAKSVFLKLNSSGEKISEFQSENLCLNALTEMPDGSYAVGGSEIVNYSDHAYVAVIDRQCKNIIWDNTEMMYPSLTGELLINTIGCLTGVFTVDDKMLLATLDFSEKLSEEK